MSSYTLEEAEEILPEVERVVKDVRRLHRRITKISKTAIEDIEINDEDGGVCLRYSFVEGSPEVDNLISDVNAKLAILERAGIIMRDIDKGEIEFPSLFQGRRIIYFWKVGMKSIRHWCSEEDGFEKMKRIVDLATNEDP